MLYALSFRPLFHPEYGREYRSADEAEAVVVACRVLEPAAEGAGEAVRSAEVRHQA